MVNNDNCSSSIVPLFFLQIIGWYWSHRDDQISNVSVVVMLKTMHCNVSLFANTTSVSFGVRTMLQFGMNFHGVPIPVEMYGSHR